MPDIDEDLNQNGKFDREPYYLKSEDRTVHETDFRDADTDDDGLSDAYETGFCGLDTNFLNKNKWTNGTNPLDPDTDHDGLPDGLELGLTSPADGVRRWLAHIPSPPIKDTNLSATFKYRKKIKDGLVTIERPCFIADADPESITDPTRDDTNGDGLPDGEQDVNANGRCDPGETSASAGFVFDDVTGQPDFEPTMEFTIDSLDTVEMTYQAPSSAINKPDTIRISNDKLVEAKYIKIFPDKRYWKCIFIYTPEEEKQQDFTAFSIYDGRSITTKDPDENLRKMIALWENNHIATIPPRRNFLKVLLHPKEMFSNSIKIYGESSEFIKGQSPQVTINTVPLMQNEKR